MADTPLVGYKLSPGFPEAQVSEFQPYHVASLGGHLAWGHERRAEVKSEVVGVRELKLMGRPHAHLSAHRRTSFAARSYERFAHDQIVGAVVAMLRGFACQRPRFGQNGLVTIQKAVHLR